MRRIGIFWATVALVAGMVGCASAPSSYDLTIFSSEGGELTTPGEGTHTYEAGVVVNLVATPGAGYRFVNWTGDVDTIDDVNTASTIITMNDNYEITANFEAIPPGKYSLTIRSTTGGSVTSPGPGTFTYDKGTIVNLVATPTGGYQFIKWTGDINTVANVSAASTTIAMNGYCTITASFAMGIYDWYDLDAIRDNLDASYILVNDLDSATPGYEELASPTANGGKGWQPIGVWDPYDYELQLAFTGTFDGQKHEIRDLFIGRPAEWEAGLFGCVAEGGMVENVSVVNATVTGERCVAGLVALNGGTVRSCSSNGTMAGEWWVGGLVGNHGGTVTNCHSSANVYGHEGEVGGLAGRNWGTITDCYATGNVTCEWAWAGGLVGDNRGTVTNSYFSGSVTGEENLGGLVGGHEVVGGTVSNSYYNYGEVLINGENMITIGALFGEDFEEWLVNDKFLDVDERLAQDNGYYVINNVSDLKQLLIFGQNSTLKFTLKKDLDLAAEPGFYIPYFAGEFDGNGHIVANLSFDFDFVSQIGLFGYLAGGKAEELGVENVAITGHTYVGGLVGYNREGILSNCYSGGDVTGDGCVGGLVGENYGGTVSNSCSSGSVSGGSDVGGLLGYLREGTVSNSFSTAGVTGDERIGGLVATVLPAGTVSSSFWDTETSGQATSDDGTGLTTMQMKSITTFSDAGWNIFAVAPGERNTAYAWNIVDGQTYPFLSWQSVS